MRLVDPQDVKKWVERDGFHSANAVSGVCPKCNQKILFSLSQFSYDPARDTVAATAVCPDCSKKVHFWTVKPKSRTRADHGEVFMHPTAPDYHQSVSFGDEVPEPLKKAYHSTVDAYNAGNFVATAVCCRRTLEGLFKFLLADGAKGLSLAAAIERATKEADLAKPLHSLAHAIRQGGNLAAHFDMTKEPTRELAQAMVELLEYIINYLHVLPRQIAELDKSL